MQSQANATNRLSVELVNEWWNASLMLGLGKITFNIRRAPFTDEGCGVGPCRGLQALVAQWGTPHQSQRPGRADPGLGQPELSENLKALPALPALVKGSSWI